MSDLAQELVEVAIDEIVNAPHDDHDVVDYEVAGRRAAGAVLRRLARAYSAHLIHPDLRALANSIKKGGETDVS
jgi:hypothetical protein